MKVNYSAIFSYLENKMIQASIVFLFIMMLLVNIDVFGRYLFNRPVTGNVELTEMIMVFIVYLGMAYTHREKGHVRVEVFVDKLPKGILSNINNYISLLLSLFINVMVMVYSFQQSITTYHDKAVSIYLSIAMWPLPLVVSLGSLILCIRIIIECKKEIILRKD